MNTATITGRLGDDLELRRTSSGKAVANGRIAHTPRRLDQQTQQWVDAGETLWINFSIWEAKAEALAATAHKGDLVMVTGELVARSWDAPEGKRTVTEIKAREVAVVPAAQRQQPQQAGWAGQPQQAPQPDPWNQPQGNPWGGQPADEPAPF